MTEIRKSASPGAAAQDAARCMAESMRAAVAARGICSIALSGGRSPLELFAALARETLPWKAIHVFQVDERVAPAGSAQRNWTELSSTLLAHIRIPAANIHPMPVDDAAKAGDPGQAAAYQDILCSIAGNPPVLDLVHLGLGADGHTASLVPGDAALDEVSKEVAMTGAYQGNRRMTLTLPCLRRARQIAWFVTGEDKATALARMLANDPGAPAGRIGHDHQTVFTDLDPGTIGGEDSPTVLSVDVGGTHVKVMHSVHRERRAFESGPKLTPGQMCKGVIELTPDWSYDAVAVGLPGPVRNDAPFANPPNLGEGWVGFDYAEGFGKPVRILNDAAMQALGSYQGGKMLFLGLGTGLGGALVTNGVVVPMELRHLKYRKKKSYEDYVGEAGLKRLGKDKWRKHVLATIEQLRGTLMPDEVVIGGGNVRLLDDLPEGCRRGNNDNAFLGGFRLWSGSLDPINATPEHLPSTH